MLTGVALKFVGPALLPAIASLSVLARYLIAADGKDGCHPLVICCPKHSLLSSYLQMRTRYSLFYGFGKRGLTVAVCIVPNFEQTKD